ncbi:MFS transporter [Thiomicrorhabdus aquaedulcis]|uniref:MFS transporter n=1 Tax=Thiomicrorhabdus aquaedulcis TaxID=2211106 RepID=UPI001561DBB2|nr:MFS transporter [Thiomicrorhabdus aquaedulcis]
MSVHAPNKAFNGSANSSLLAPKTSFFALFWVQFLGAFNDNLFKNALVMLIAFKLTTDNSGLLITLAAGLFILPFFLFSSLAGQLADRYPKAWLLQKIKLAEVLIMSLGAWALWMQHLEGLLIVLFLMGAQSAFFGPLKYAILPEILPNQQLLQGNGLISGSTFIAILLGTILGGLGVLLEHGLALMAGTVMLVALLGYGASVRLLVLSRRGAKLPVQNPSVAVELNIIKSTWTMVALSRSHRQAFWAVLAISWFWFMGAVLLSQFPTLVKTHLISDDGVVVAFLTLFSVGVAVGSGLMVWLLKGQVTLKWHAFC